MNSTLVGQKAVLTGAGGVIGRWLARGLREAGADLCLTDTGPEALNGVLADLGTLGLGSAGFTHPADLTDPAQVRGLADEVDARWGAPDILVNNAGIYPSAFLLDTSDAEWDLMFDINLRAPFLLTRDLARLMVAAGKRGSIVNISSGGAKRARRTAVAYCTSKVALDRLSEGFALELAEYGIRVNTLYPGFAAGSGVTSLTDAHVQTVSTANPMGRPTEAQDLIGPLVFLCSEEARFITGATLAVDGGGSAGVMTVFQDKKRAL